MHGLMQDRPLALPHVFHRAERLFGHKYIATGDTRATYAEWAVRVSRLATVLDSLGVTAGGRVGSFAWNTQRHLELYFAVPCTGRILHTVNIRLFSDQIRYIIQHAADEVMFVDRSLLPLIWPIADELDSVRRWVVMDDGSDAEIPDDRRIEDYERLLADAEPFTGRFVIEDENTAAALCYTSGTTGDPKGVLYSHRSTVLHSLMSMSADVLGLSERDTLLPVVPMFHVNAWGLPYSGVFAGANLVFPGPMMRPEAILGLIERHRVTVTAGVPTIWMGALPFLSGHALASLRLVLAGGAAVPKSLSEEWRTRVGLPITQAWGMTETSPLATLNAPRSHLDCLEAAAVAEARAGQGQPVPLVNLRIVDAESGEELPWDGTAFGELEAAGPWIASAYSGDEKRSDSFTADGWLRTGDIATIDPHGYVRLVDRTKDLVKSGGEWISSVRLENEIMAHPDVVEAAVIAKPDPRWSERPAACVVLARGARLSAQEITEFLRPRVATWWLPDEVHFIDEMPKTSTGKFSKKALRERFYPQAEIPQAS
jgi:fatty-acyl-CoA synthase